VDTLYHLCTDPKLNHRVEVKAGVMAGECAALLTSFFAAKRAMGKK
jgi:tRNA(adenine34) deaminase